MWQRYQARNLYGYVYQQTRGFARGYKAPQVNRTDGHN